MTNKSHDTDVAFIKALAELLHENDLTELQVKRDYGADDSLNVRVSRQKNVVTTSVVPTPAPAPSVPGVPPAASGGTVKSDASSDATGDDPANHPGAVTSPMVGTVYMQAEPGSPAFVSVGSTVAEGDTLLIVEAMKTMNQIPAPRAGTVKRIMVEDGAAVEYGAPLMIIE